jgi:hypothetical protein
LVCPFNHRWGYQARPPGITPRGKNNTGCFSPCTVQCSLDKLGGRIKGLLCIRQYFINALPQFFPHSAVCPFFQCGRGFLEFVRCGTNRLIKAVTGFFGRPGAPVTDKFPSAKPDAEHGCNMKNVPDITIEVFHRCPVEKGERTVLWFPVFYPVKSALDTGRRLFKRGLGFLQSFA